MKITLEAIEKVMNLAGVDYAAAKEALLKAEGDAEKAIKDLQPKVYEELKLLLAIHFIEAYRLHCKEKEEI